MENESILQTTRAALGLPSTTEEFNFEIQMHINAAFAILNQNGVGRKNLSVTPDMTWGDFKDPTQVKGNEYSTLIPLFVQTRTKIIFDPPPPSNVDFYHQYIQEILWRLRLAYEKDQEVTIIE